MTNAQTRSRLAAMSTAPANFMRTSGTLRTRCGPSGRWVAAARPPGRRMIAAARRRRLPGCRFRARPFVDGMTGRAGPRQPRTFEEVPIMGAKVIHVEVTGKDGAALQSFYSDIFGW